MLRVRLSAPMRATSPREQGVPLDAGASCGMVQRTRGRKGKRRAAALADVTALTGTEGLTDQTESLAREDRN
ncbi:MAG: hypothetical protein IKN78_01115 [Bacteroidales bacterium]|nr:hypothetical protein [Bacteroidales bacterium]